MKEYNIKSGKYIVKEYIPCVDSLVNVETGEHFEYENNYNLKESKEILQEFYSKKNSTTNSCIKDDYLYDKIDWFPANVSYLYWTIFGLYIKFNEIVNLSIDKKAKFYFENNYDCKNYISMINLFYNKKNSELVLKNIIYYFKYVLNLLIFLRNVLIVNSKSDIILYRYGLNDFRTKEIYEELIYEDKIPVQALGLSYKEILKNFFNRNIFILFVYNIKYNNKSYLKNENKIYDFALDQIGKRVNYFRMSYQYYKFIFKFKSFKFLLSIDDTNYVYPLLYACQDSGMKTVAFQHGAYTSSHEAYLLDSFNNIRWFNYLIVWGEYWKDFLLKKSNIINGDKIIIGANKNTYMLKPLLEKKSETKNILIPYEFLTDTKKVGIYIKKLLNNGFSIFFKVRSDEPINDQVFCYGLNKDILLNTNFTIIKDINPELMAEIDVVAGSMTTLIFDLMIYKKPIWIFDLGYSSFLNDIIENKTATLVNLDNDFIDLYERSIKNGINYDIDYYFSKKMSITKTFLNLVY
ncbi:hypothetical protein GCL60_13275 [Silvanigrella paludirubra]|uniref:Uncharacterized protein n=1 Tax=Silvanigrella paludirubra TaxID=2499159 RepID=A0A6N6VR90_9BACT|nr:hypothetical protein [Silvanigrella paludirubra]KAB8036810.1 hypothetical protein GCL60_13275 [Silvanigrella paludirubra]